jgi:hypothetical protein
MICSFIDLLALFLYCNQLPQQASSDHSRPFAGLYLNQTGYMDESMRLGYANQRLLRNPYRTKSAMSSAPSSMHYVRMFLGDVKGQPLTAREPIAPPRMFA